VLSSATKKIHKLQSPNLLSMKDLSLEDIELILKNAESFEEVSDRVIKKVPALRGKTIVNLFLEPSTRTKTSFELAAKRLSADTISISKDASAFAKGESLKDTAKTLEAYNVDAIVIRHNASGAAKLLTTFTDASVINAGDGNHEHPSQALLDLYTLRKQFGNLKGLHIGIVGDILHSRVARSNIYGFQKMGCKVTVMGPQTLMPYKIEEMGVDVSNDFDKNIPDLDVIYLLRIQLERQKDRMFPSIREYSARYGLNMQRLKNAKKDAIIMHPGPMNRGVEITSEAADSVGSLVTEQVASGVAVRMAIMYLLIGGGESG
jgi:aspartate carbamoyltransferase catalytic subunit